jgi:cation diffusion facilitator family transporter
MVLGLNIALVGALVAVGVSAHSLGVLAAGADYLADATAIGVALFAIWLSGRPATSARPQGYPKATAWAALVNGGWLLVLAALIIAASINRLARGATEVHGLPVLVASSIAALVMTGAALILGGDKDDDDHGGNLNVHAVLLDTASDAVTAASVAVTGVVILATRGNYWLDPTVALAVSAVIAYHAIKLLRGVIEILRTGTREQPSHL